jgi:predicted dehydrogenase
MTSTGRRKAASRRIRLGLIGTGRWGRRYAATVERMWPDGAVCVSDVAGRSVTGGPRLDGTARRWPSWMELIGSAGVDGVIIATPASTHVTIATGAMAAGLPVLIEKPATLSVEGAVHLLTVAHDTSARVMVGHQHLHAAAFQGLKVRAGHRPIVAIECAAGGDGPVREDCDVLWDYGPHDLAMALALIGPQEPYSVLSARCDDGGNGRQTWWFTVGAGPARIDVTVSNDITVKQRWLHVTFADGGTLSYNAVGPRRFIADDGPEAVDSELPLDREVRSFVALVTDPDRAGHDDLYSSLTIAKILSEVQTVGVFNPPPVAS